MLVSYAVSERTKIDIEVKDVKTAFSFLSYADSVFGTKKCGNCDSDNLSLVHRQPQGYDYYSVKCNECKHELKFGQQKEGGKLFPKGWEEPYYAEGEDDTNQDKPKSRRQRDDDDNQDREPVGAGNGRKSNDDIPF
jgi:hypothetical protein